MTVLLCRLPALRVLAAQYIAGVCARWSLCLTAVLCFCCPMRRSQRTVDELQRGTEMMPIADIERDRTVSLPRRKESV